jgi:putative ABC transport system substrate-binding protein
MKRREALKNISTFVALVGTPLGFEAIAEAQPRAKIAKIGWLGIRAGTGEGDAYRGSTRTLRMLRERGYVEGKNIVIEYLFADNNFDRLPALAEDFVRRKVDLIVVSHPKAVVAAKNATTTIPIVFLFPADPVAAGVVDSLAHPGGNVTGFTTIGSELAGKRLELIKETVPKVSRVGVLWSPEANPQQWQESQLAARELGLQFHSMEVSSADKLEAAYRGAIKARSTALAVTLNPFNNAHQKQIANLAAKHRLPAIYGRADFVDNGGLMSYGADQEEPYRRLAYYIDRILTGTKPADLPVERPMRFELVMNLKTAEALRLTIPPIVLMRVTRVVK